ncbi:exocyst complex component EXO70B1-like [Abrus precatorius]|uniref:Exocyst subunit Exo70 family protein n=1 Tax=Abrus precatorius TaxID=3816 RepID=A0A8B8JQA9_ABRPR|nr:exocyst complex component EXO70B1-like [Abrus precatorius]
MPNQFLRWPMKPKAWNFFCFTSSIVGLFCYALSSSFNHLLGKRKLWKLLLYIVFSFIICLAILFAKVWQRSPSLQLKAHLAFLVLIITSVYSFFFDKLLNGKPDAYSLISCAAFAIMSLCLSRQIHYGFEVDLLYFFSGCLIIQLMMIKLFLVLAGAGFTYSLIIIRSYLDAPIESGHFSLLVQDQVVIEVDLHPPQTNTDSAVQVDSSHANRSTTNAHFMMPQVPKENGDLGFQDHIVTPVDSHSKQGNSDSVLIMSQLMRCIEALKKENRNLFRMISKHVEEYLKAKLDFEDEDHISVMQLYVDNNVVIDALPSRIVNNLHETVKLMVEAGLEKKCCRVYSRCRRKFLKEWLSRFRLHEMNMNGVDKMEKIEKWIKALNVAVKILFPNEKKLCDRVFFGFSSATDTSLIEVCTKLTIRLLSFIDTFATERHSLSLLSSIIPKVFKTLRDLIPEFESLFSDPYSVSLRHVRMFWGILPLKMEFNNLISRDMAQEGVLDGRVQRITIEVMDRLYELSRKLTVEKQMKSPLVSLHMASFICMLESNLEAKSKTYTDPAMGYVYMMNNLRCIEQIARQRELKNILGDDWFPKTKEKIQKSLELYQLSSWNKVLNILKLDNELVVPSVVAELMKIKLSLFNLHFEEICNIQSTWSVFDEQLREQIIILLESTLLPAYGKFIERICDVLGKHADEYIEYGMLHIQDRLNHLFLISEPVNLLHKIWKEDIDFALRTTSESLRMTFTK